jgi:hypothetical protein
MSLWSVVDVILLLALVVILARLFVVGTQLKNLTQNTQYEQPVNKVLKAIILAVLVMLLIFIRYGLFWVGR